MHRLIQKLCRQTRNNWINNECKEAEELEKKNPSKFHNKINKLTWKSSKVSHSLINAQGEEIFEAEKILERWREYCNNLYEDDRSEPREHREIQPDEIPVFTEDDIIKLIKTLSNRKAYGSDEIPAEFLKLLDSRGIQHIANIMNEIYRSGIIPQDFLESIFIPMPKVNKAKHCGDFRTISLISHTSKILLKLIKHRIEDIIEKNLSETQIGFRRGKGCRDGITGLRILLEKAVEMKKDVFLAFVDFQKAFDNIKHPILIKILEDLKIPSAEIRLIECLYWNQKGKVRTKEGTSSAFEVKKGVRQGCIISPILFNIFVEQIVNETLHDIDIGFKIGEDRINNLRYADDTLLVTESVDDLTYLLTKLFEVCEKYGMKINMKKTQVMHVSKKKIEEQIMNMNVAIKGEKLEEVQQYKYLGARITSDGRCTTEINIRAGIAKQAFWKHKNLFRSGVKLETKLKILKTYVFSILTYGCESWTLNERQEKKITAFEFWCYRRILKISWRDRITNIEVLRRMNLPSVELLTTIKQRKTRYAGHIIRGSSGTLLAKIIEGKVEGTRDRGRQRRKWIDNIIEWTKTTTYENCKRMAQDREAWRQQVWRII
ncbi:hypothetical protein M8J77_018598 [Diaphorina citri]|nr:hypothetical protein M8J77_018598 [Diaphorina citri]